MAAKIEDIDEFNEAKPDDILSVGIEFPGFDELADLEEDAVRSYQRIESDDSIQDKTAVRRQRYSELIGPFWTISCEYLLPAAQQARALIQTAFSLVGKDLQTPQFSEDCSLTLPCPKRVAEQLAEAMQEIEGIRGNAQVYVRTHNYSDDQYYKPAEFDGHIQYTPVNPIGNPAEAEQGALLEITTGDLEKELVTMDGFMSRAKITADRHQALLDERLQS